MKMQRINFLYLRKEIKIFMTTITLKINEHTQAGKNFLESVQKNKSVTILDEESPYDPEFVKKILHSHKYDKRIVINPKDVWGSLGLK
jgi:DNA-binding transcriptional regulator PaaX